MISDAIIATIHNYISEIKKLGHTSCTLTREHFGASTDVNEITELLRIRYPASMFSPGVNQYGVDCIGANFVFSENSTIYTRKDLQQIYLETKRRKQIINEEKWNAFISSIIPKIIEDASNGHTEKRVKLPFEEDSFSYLTNALQQTFPDMYIKFKLGDPNNQNSLELNWDWR